MDTTHMSGDTRLTQTTSTSDRLPSIPTDPPAPVIHCNGVYWPSYYHQPPPPPPPIYYGAKTIIEVLAQNTHKHDVEGFITTLSYLQQQNKIVDGEVLVPAKSSKGFFGTRSFSWWYNKRSGWVILGLGTYGETRKVSVLALAMCFPAKHRTPVLSYIMANGLIKINAPYVIQCWNDYSIHALEEAIMNCETELLVFLLKAGATVKSIEERALERGIKGECVSNILLLFTTRWLKKHNLAKFQCAMQAMADAGADFDPEICRITYVHMEERHIPPPPTSLLTLLADSTYTDCAAALVQLLVHHGLNNFMFYTTETKMMRNGLYRDVTRQSLRALLNGIRIGKCQAAPWCSIHAFSK